MPTYPPSQPLYANVAPVTVAKPVTLVTPGQLLPTASSAAILSHILQPSAAVVPSSKTASTVPSSRATSSMVPSSQATSSMVPSTQSTSTIVPSSQPTSYVLSPSENVSSPVPRKQLEGRSENKETKQREWKAKQSAVAQSKEPLLPAPKPVSQKLVGPSSYVQYNNKGHVQYHNRGHVQYNNRGLGRGRGWGRGNGQLHPTTQFTEDFDFMAMNEKFNKDEVWGHLGRSSGQFDDDTNDYEDSVLEDDEISPRKPEAKPVYVKDDFFDLLSCNTIDNGGRTGRIKFSEQRKIYTETFGDSARHRPMGIRGGRGPHGGGPRGRGDYGRGYGYMGRGHGYSYPNLQS